MSLDVLTPRGLATVLDEESAARLWESHHADCRYVATPKDSASSVDAILTSGSGLVAVAETKCRYRLTLDEFQGKFRGEWLITMDKLVKASQVAASLCVPLYGFLYLVEERVLLTERIANEQGHFVVKMHCDRTETQKTVNGGSIVRYNAYVDMTSAKLWR